MSLLINPQYSTGRTFTFHRESLQGTGRGIRTRAAIENVVPWLSQAQNSASMPRLFLGKEAFYH
jgi:hypothetical protein